MTVKAMPPIRKRPLTVEDRVRKIQKMLRRFIISTGATVALQKLQTSGAQGVPMTRAEVAMATGRTVQAINDATHLKRLHMRYPAVTSYHPDDVRAYMEGKTVARSKAKASA